MGLLIFFGTSVVIYIVLDKLLESLIVSDINHDDLLLGDKNAILIQARISGYGQLYEAKIQCPSCAEEQEREFDLEECLRIEEGSFDFEGGKLGPGQPVGRVNPQKMGNF